MGTPSGRGTAPGSFLCSLVYAPPLMPKYAEYFYDGGRTLVANAGGQLLAPNISAQLQKWLPEKGIDWNLATVAALQDIIFAALKGL